MNNRIIRIILITILSAAVITLASLFFQQSQTGSNGESMQATQINITLAPIETEVPIQSPVPTPPPTAIQLMLSPTPTVDSRRLCGVIVGIDPGHQAHSNSELEPVAPGSSEQKKKVSSGTSGIDSGIREHEVNLAVGLLLRDLLEAEGATVIMTRETADVDISNAERAQIFNAYQVDLGLRIHCNGSEDESVQGAFMLVPTENPFQEDCVRAAETILSAYGAVTGINIDRGLTFRSDQTEFNWCERPVVNSEMGHMTNPKEDRKLTDSEFQVKMAEGLYQGILAYFTEQ